MQIFLLALISHQVLIRARLEEADRVELVDVESAIAPEYLSTYQTSYEIFQADATIYDLPIALPVPLDTSHRGRQVISCLFVTAAILWYAIVSRNALAKLVFLLVLFPCCVVKLLSIILRGNRVILH
jgi:hypothetical protein